MALSSGLILINHGPTINFEPVGKQLSTLVNEQQLKYEINLKRERKLLKMQENQVISYQQRHLPNTRFVTRFLSLVHAKNR